MPFDFLIDGELLRSSLEDYLTKRGLSSETLLDVEYFFKQKPAYEIAQCLVGSEMCIRDRCAIRPSRSDLTGRMCMWAGVGG